MLEGVLWVYSVVMTISGVMEGELGEWVFIMGTVMLMMSLRDGLTWGEGKQERGDEGLIILVGSEGLNINS